MNEKNLKKLINDIKNQKVSEKKALEILRDLPYQDIEYAKIDHHRMLRKGFPEVVFGKGKTPEQTIRIANEIYKKNKKCLLTRISNDVYKKIYKSLPEHEYNMIGRTVLIGKLKKAVTPFVIPIFTGGTSDMPVAEEAADTLRIMGNPVEKHYDVGAAGVHRVLDKVKLIRNCRVVIVIAGMDGVLPTIVGGLLKQTVIAVPASTGYGASFDGLAPLLTMLNSCVPGILVVNIDNGFGAAYAASAINQL